MPKLKPIVAACLLAGAVWTASASPAHAEPNGFTLALDCDVATAGVQSSCVLANGQTPVEVAWVLTNDSPVNSSVATIDLRAHDPDTARLNPPAIADPPLHQDSNPDFNQAGVTRTWDCTLPAPPDNDTGADGPGTAVSYILCFVLTGPGPELPAAGSIELARVRYAAIRTATGGTVTITPDAAVGTNGGWYDIDCLIPPVEPTGTCASTNLKLPCMIAIADVNDSNQVNVGDLAAIAQHNGEMPAPPQYDVNADGQINVIDLQITAQLNNRHISQCLP
jgi:hypothetical protein